MPAHMRVRASRDRSSAVAPAGRSVKYRFARPPRCGVGSDILELT